ncbi:ABC transporter substrate-binding protein [Aldersonia kunmingensis]|uniref:ABC transporter substrate-binding protein n=1 Tax=Aldersonia kunmingensis TaxID=408066 RepID=UPI000837783B|nr:ABC transporter substrate-binding protein [Aldersonia kunmingensis]
MNLRRFAALAVVASAAVALVAGCGSSSDDSQTTADGKTVLRYQGSPSQVRWYELADHLGYFERVSLEWKGDTTSGPQDIQSVATNQVDIGGAFNGSVAKLQQAGSKVTAVLSDVGSDADTFQGYYSLEGSGINTARDLIGKKVGINTLGAYHEYAIKEWLHREGLSDNEINQVEFLVVPPVNTEQALHQKQIDVGNLGTIIKDVALEHGGLHELFRDTDLIGSLAISSFVVRDDYLESNPDDVRDFVQGTARAIRWAQTHTREEVIAKYEEIINARGRAENTDYVQHWKSAGVPTPGGVIHAEEYSLWVDEAVRLGELPAGIDVNTLFTNEYNPYANGTYKPDADSEGNALASK